MDALERTLYACGLRMAVDLVPLSPSPRREALIEHRREIHALLSRYGASNPRVFGSVARGEDKDGSDVDLLIDLPETPGGRSRLLSVLALSNDLKESTGIDVDVSPVDFLEPEIRESALRDAVSL